MGEYIRIATICGVDWHPTEARLAIVATTRMAMKPAAATAPQKFFVSDMTPGEELTMLLHSIADSALYHFDLGRRSGAV